VSPAASHRWILLFALLLLAPAALADPESEAVDEPLSCPTQGDRLTFPYPPQVPEGWEHDRFGTTGGDTLTIEAGAFVSAFTPPDREEDGSPYRGLPRWVAYEMRALLDETGVPLQPAGARRPGHWYELEQTAPLWRDRPGLTHAGLDRSYRGFATHWNRGHLAARAHANRLGWRDGCNSHVFVTSLGPKGPSFWPRGHFIPVSDRFCGSIRRPTPDVLRFNNSVPVSNVCRDEKIVTAPNPAVNHRVCGAKTWINALPEQAGLNQGEWEALENHAVAVANHFGRVWTIAGPVFEPDRPVETIGAPGTVPLAVPHALFKILAVETPVGLEVRAFLFPQDGVYHRCLATPQDSYDLGRHAVTLARLEALTGLRFFTHLSPAHRAEIERDSAAGPWPVPAALYARRCGPRGGRGLPGRGDPLDSGPEHHGS